MPADPHSLDCPCCGTRAGFWRVYLAPFPLAVTCGRCRRTLLVQLPGALSDVLMVGLAALYGLGSPLAFTLWPNIWIVPIVGISVFASFGYAWVVSRYATLVDAWPG